MHAPVDAGGYGKNYCLEQSLTAAAVLIFFIRFGLLQSVASLVTIDFLRSPGRG
jgi:hypothetical protein